MYCDRRLIGDAKWYYKPPKDAYMRIPPTLEKSVCFLCWQIKEGPLAGQFKPCGTGVFIAVKEQGWDFLYLVTALHCVDIEDQYLPLYARVNLKNGGSKHIPLPPKAEWARYTNEALDVAIFSLPLPPDEFDYMALSIGSLMTEELIAKHSIGLGDDIFTVGLHVHHAGGVQNVPIVRTGIIAMMPLEPIYDARKDDTHIAYLAELRSIGGLSGSPVYVLVDRFRLVNPNLDEDIDWKWGLLGIVRGHHKLPKSFVEEIEANADDLTGIDIAPNAIGTGESLNMGIALITPAQFIWRLLMNDEMDRHRKQWAVRQGAPPDTLDLDTDDDGTAFTSADFESALKKASQRMPPSGLETKETSE